jgi:hypothetical protein
LSNRCGRFPIQSHRFWSDPIVQRWKTGFLTLSASLILFYPDKNYVRSTLLMSKIVSQRDFIAVECKAGEKNLNPSLYYFIERTKIPEFYQVHEGNRDFEKGGVRILPIWTFCNELQLP